MGSIKLLSEGIPDLLPMEGRSPGVHVSDVISRLAVALGHFPESSPEERAARMTQMQLGSALEDAIVDRYSRAYPDRFLRVGELEKDSLFGTPDLFDLEDWVLVEIKLTWMSAKHEPDSVKFWRYWVQVKAYCWMMETAIGRLQVGFVNGDYKNFRPVYKVWEQTFTKQELEENWRMLTSHADKMRKEERR